jgi:hypothetical protein
VLAQSGVQQQPTSPQSPHFQHNAHNSPKANNLKAGLVPNSDITRRIPGSQRFLPPLVAPGWTPYHLLPGADASTELATAEEAQAEEHDAVEEEGSADDNLNNGGQDFATTVHELINDWGIEPDLAHLIADI